MKKKQENGVGEPGQFKITPVVGFTPTDYTPTESPAAKKVENFKRNSAKVQSAEKTQLKRVLKHHRKGENKE